MSQSAFDFVELVGDVEDRAAARGEAPQRLEELGDLLRRQHRGRLVHDQELRVQQQRTDDLDPLPLADRERRDRAVGIERQPVLRQHRADALLELGVGEFRVEAERDVLEHGQRLEQREVLEDHADPDGARGLGARDVDGEAVEADLARVRLLDAVDHLDQRRLAGAVLAEKRVDLARANREAHPVVGEDAREGLGDLPELQAKSLLGHPLTR